MNATRNGFQLIEVKDYFSIGYRPNGRPYTQAYVGCSRDRLRSTVKALRAEGATHIAPLETPPHMAWRKPAKTRRHRA